MYNCVELEAPVPENTPYTDFLFAAGKILLPTVAKSVTRIVGVRKDGRPNDHRGTALLCTFAGRQAFVTANHVLTEIESSDDYKCFRVSAATEEFRPNFLIFPDIDIAVIMPEREIPIREERVFWPSEVPDKENPNAMLNLDPFDPMLVYGFPARFSRFSALVPGTVSEGYSLCTWVRPRRSQALQPEWSRFAEIDDYPPVADEVLLPWEFCLNFAEHTGPLKTLQGEVVVDQGMLFQHSGLYFYQQTLPGMQPNGPYGLSGSPVWRFGAREAGWSMDRWSPRSTHLAGIVTRWGDKDKQHYLVATNFGEIATRVAGSI